MQVLFDGKILDNSFLSDVQTQASQTQGKWDVVYMVNGEAEVLATKDTEQAAKDFVNSLSDKLKAHEFIEVIDAR